MKIAGIAASECTRPGGVIYRVRNLKSGKAYVGQTRQSLGERWSKHKYAGSQSKILRQAMTKHGVENFVIEPICSALRVEDLSALEVQFIKSENTLSPNGYNAVLPDETYTMSEESLQKKSRSSKAKYADPEYKKKWTEAILKPGRCEKIAESSRDRWSDPEYKARVSASIKAGQSSPEFRAHRSKIMKRRRAESFVPIDQYSLSGEFMATFVRRDDLVDSGFNPQIVLPVVRGDRYCSRGRTYQRKSAYGCLWKRRDK